MKIRNDQPFYLQGKGKNILTSEIIDHFFIQNPELNNWRSLSPNLILRTLNISTFESFVYWIISQVISGKTAKTIIQQVNYYFNKQNLPLTPESFLSMSDHMLIELGISRLKIKYIRNVADFLQQNGELSLKSMRTAEIIKYYTQIKGIGEWSVQMHLIFVIGRLDIYSPKDLVVRKGIQRLYGLDNIPNESLARKFCKSWGELSTIGTILSWAVMGE